jgi:hypothetical protein
MRSTRLAVLSVAVGSALLGWATAGVSAVGSDLPSTTTKTVTVPASPSTTTPTPRDGRPCDHDGDGDGGRGHRGHPGV